MNPKKYKEYVPTTPKITSLTNRQTEVTITTNNNIMPTTTTTTGICDDANASGRRRSDGGGITAGLKATFGSNFQSVALYRISLGIMLLVELVSRYQYLHPFYSDEG